MIILCVGVFYLYVGLHAIWMPGANGGQTLELDSLEF